MATSALAMTLPWATSRTAEGEIGEGVRMLLEAVIVCLAALLAPRDEHVDVLIGHAALGVENGIGAEADHREHLYGAGHVMGCREAAVERDPFRSLAWGPL